MGEFLFGLTVGVLLCLWGKFRENEVRAAEDIAEAVARADRWEREALEPETLEEFVDMVNDRFHELDDESVD